VGGADPIAGAGGREDDIRGTEDVDRPHTVNVTELGGDPGAVDIERGSKRPILHRQRWPYTTISELLAAEAELPLREHAGAVSSCSAIRLTSSALFTSATT
jgi:hypothetical protein